MRAANFHMGLAAAIGLLLAISAVRAEDNGLAEFNRTVTNLSSAIGTTSPSSGRE